MTHRRRAAVVFVVTAGLVLSPSVVLGNVEEKQSFSIPRGIEQVMALLQGWLGRPEAHAKPSAGPQKTGAQLEPNGEPQEVGVNLEPNGKQTWESREHNG